MINRFRKTLSAAVAALSACMMIPAVAQDRPPPGLASPKLIAEPAQPASFPLYPSGAPPITGATSAERWDLFGPDVIVRNVTQPTITPFLPAPGSETGAGVIIAPGGGFMILSVQNEGWDVARWFAEHGVAAFVLKYRVEPTPEDERAFEKFALAKLFQPIVPGKQRVQLTYSPAVEDGLAALTLIRSRASEWHVDPSRLGMLGFSAGAATTLKVTLTAPPQAAPAFIGLMYAPPQPITMPAKIPPLFAAVASDDTVVGPDRSAVDAWHAAGQSAEYHLYARGGHGFGMRKSGATTDLWPVEFLAWLSSNGFLSKPVR